MILRRFRRIPLRAYWRFSIKTTRNSTIKIKLLDAFDWCEYPIHRKVTLYLYLRGGGLALKKHCRFHAGLRFLINRLWLPRGAP